MGTDAQIFLTSDAQKFGVNAAVLLYHFKWWIAKNKANGRHEHGGRTWTYNSTAAFVKLFPFLTAGQIRVALKLLIDNGILITGNYNPSGYDRTLWYAFADERAILPAEQMDSLSAANRLVVQSKTQDRLVPEKVPIKEGDLFRKNDVPFPSDELPPPLNTPEIRDLWDNWQEHRRESGKKLSKVTARQQVKELREMGAGRAEMALRHSIKNGYTGLYEPGDKNKPPRKKTDWSKITSANALDVPEQ